MRNRLVSRGFLAALSAAVLSGMIGMARAELVVAGEEHCVVNVRADDALNMRAGPSAQSAVVATKAFGECGIRVNEGCSGNWCPVEDGHAIGWMHRRYLAMVSPSLYCVSGVGNGDILNMRAYPSADSAILATLAPNQCDIAFLPYSVGSWQKIRVGGFAGWVNRTYLSGQ
jgi:SH3-like domain-containing protein